MLLFLNTPMEVALFCSITALFIACLVLLVLKAKRLDWEYELSNGNIDWLKLRQAANDWSICPIKDVYYNETVQRLTVQFYTAIYNKDAAKAREILINLRNYAVYQETEDYATHRRQDLRDS